MTAARGAAPARARLLALAALAAGAGLACLCLPLRLTLPQAAPAGSPTPKPTLTATPTSTPADEEEAACVAQLTAALRETQIDYPTGVELDEEYYLVSYQVSGEALFAPEYGQVPDRYGLPGYRRDGTLHRQLWQYAAGVMPDELQSRIDWFVLYTDGVSGSLGSVQLSDAPEAWMLELDLMDAEFYPGLSTTLVHEIAHLLSLNDSQVPVDLEIFYHPDDEQVYAEAQAACDTYFTFEGCRLPESYLNVFFQRFWPGHYAAWLEIDSIVDDDRRSQALSEFYERRSDDFVSEYAATSPEEDLAESFVHFVFTSPPSGDTLAEQKVLFFYEYPELVEMRREMLDPLCAGLEAP